MLQEACPWGLLTPKTLQDESQSPGAFLILSQSICPCGTPKIVHGTGPGEGDVAFGHRSGGTVLQRCVESPRVSPDHRALTCHHVKSIYP